MPCRYEAAASLDPALAEEGCTYFDNAVLHRSREMSDASNDETLITIKNSIDFGIVEDNILDIADFTVEKYEFRNDTTLSPDVREAAMSRIRDVLWQKVEAIKLRRQKLLEDMFNAAQATLDDMVGKT